MNNLTFVVKRNLDRLNLGLSVKSLFEGVKLAYAGNSKQRRKRQRKFTHSKQ